MPAGLVLGEVAPRLVIRGARTVGVLRRPTAVGRLPAVVVLPLLMLRYMGRRRGVRVALGEAAEVLLLPAVVVARAGAAGHVGGVLRPAAGLVPRLLIVRVGGPDAGQIVALVPVALPVVAPVVVPVVVPGFVAVVGIVLLW